MNKNNYHSNMVNEGNKMKNIWIRVSYESYLPGISITIELNNDCVIRRRELSMEDKYKLKRGINRAHYATLLDIELAEKRREEEIELLWTKIKLDKQKCENVDTLLKKVDFSSLQEKYIDLSVCDGGSMTFEIFEENFTKTIKVVNYHEEDKNLNLLSVVARYLSDISKVE